MAIEEICCRVTKLEHKAPIHSAMYVYTFSTHVASTKEWGPSTESNLPPGAACMMKLRLLLRGSSFSRAKILAPALLMRALLLLPHATMRIAFRPTPSPSPSRKLLLAYSVMLTPHRWMRAPPLTISTPEMRSQSPLLRFQAPVLP